MPDELEVVRTAYDDPVVTALVVDLQAEYARRYGSGDDTVVDPAEFAPPRGAFLLGRWHGRAVAIGGWRARESGPRGLADGDAELKRMYVVPDAQGRGFARTLLAALERTAAEAGRRRVVLETGTEQPEALGLYESSGYVPTTKFGHYADEASSRCYAKVLATAPRAGVGRAAG
ncbi:GNAT family N-acetyltransferase [Rhodococcus aerolatus]